MSAALTNTPTATSASRGLALAIGASLLFSAAIWLANGHLAGWTLAVREPGGPRIYPWQLAEPGPWSRATAWSGYLLHQLTIWGVIWKAQSTGLRYTAALKPINVFALLATAGFILLHFAQTHLFYDGLAQDVPEWSAMWSVILLLLVVMLMENRRRGLAFGVPVGGFVESAGAIARRYHGYYFAWATIYTFWYHPMEDTWGHLFGFFYMFLLMLQGSLFFTRAHVNPRWTVVLEVTFAVHGGMVAYLAGQGWQMFLLGGLAMFVITQMHGLGLSRRSRWLVALGYGVAVAGVYAFRGFGHLPELAGIPLTLLAGVFVLALLVLGGQRALRPA
jgi:hypothetical protein